MSRPDLNRVSQHHHCPLRWSHLLRNSTHPIEAKLTPQKAEAADLERVSFDEKSFRFEMNEDPMATEKMAEAIRRFAVDTRKLQEIVESKF